MSLPRLVAFAAAAAIAALVPSSSPAHAQPAERYRPAPTYLAIDRIDASVDRGILTIDYEIRGQDWRWVRQERIVPILQVRGNGRGRFESVSMELRRPRGRVSLQLPRNMDVIDEVDVWITGGRIDGLRVGNVELRRMTLPVLADDDSLPQTTPQQPAQPSWATQPTVIAACGAAFDGPANEAACLDAVATSSFDPSRALALCESVMDGDITELACLRIAVSVNVDRSTALAHCEADFDTDESELACYRHAVVAPFEPSAAIDACEWAANGDVDELACLGVVVRASADPTASIHACGQSMSGQESLLACLRRVIR